MQVFLKNNKNEWTPPQLIRLRHLCDFSFYHCGTGWLILCFGLWCSSATPLTLWPLVKFFMIYDSTIDNPKQCIQPIKITPKQIECTIYYNWNGASFYLTILATNYNYFQFIPFPIENYQSITNSSFKLKQFVYCDCGHRRIVFFFFCSF